MSLYTFPVRLNYPMPGGPGVNIWHLRTTGSEPPGGVDLEGLSQLLHTFYTAIGPLFPESYSAQFIGEATTISATPVFDTSAAAWNVPGQSGNATYLPVAAQLCVTMRTDSATRSGRGRKFFGPLTSGTLEGNGTPTAAALTTLNGAFTDLVESSTGFTNGAIGVYSGKTATFRDCIGFSIADQYAVLRSRRN